MSNRLVPEIVQERGVTVIALGPEYENLDESILDDLREIILDAAQKANPPRLVIDLSNTRFFGSGFIEIVFRAYNRVNERNEGRFALSGLTDYCAEVIAITHLDRLWTIYDTRAKAVAAMAAT